MKKIALIGNPNSGKTTLFNMLTGSSQYVGNWAGVTVEKKTGMTSDKKIMLIDLPGIYSLSPYSIEEKITRKYLLNEAPDGIINIIDGTNIERNLYLTMQLADLNIPMVIAVNMIDEVEKRGGEINFNRLQAELGISVVPITARTGDNIVPLIQAISSDIDIGKTPKPLCKGTFKTDILKIQKTIEPYCKKSIAFYSMKIFEGDNDLLNELNIPQEAKKEISRIISSIKGDREAEAAKLRYDRIEQIIRLSVKKGNRDFSEKLDKILTHKFLAFPIFLGTMLLIFSLTFGPVGNFFTEIINQIIFSIISPNVSILLNRLNVSDTVYRLVLEAVVGGVGNILRFLPQIAILFFFLSLLEDSGYMARGAFITDRLLRKIGLSGKSFIPMLIGFGCTTPAVMASRTGQNIQEKRMTILLLPYMSCGAKLTIYALFAEAFFIEHKAAVVFLMYIIGIITAILTGVFLNKFICKGRQTEFIMELPPYRLPEPYSVFKTTWERCKGFLIKAGTVIFAMNIIIWLMQNFSPSLAPASGSDSIFGIIGGFVAPIFKPLGFGTSEASVSLLAGLIAKEGVVSSLCVLYKTTSFELSGALQSSFSPLSAFSYMVFCLLYTPCISALITMKRELKSAKWFCLSLIMQISTAYFASLLIFQIGGLILGLIK